MSNRPVYLTPEGYKALEKELAHLKTVRRQEVADRLHAALEEGELIENAESIVAGQTDRAKQGDADALVALLQFNAFLKIKTIKVGDTVMISKYVGIDFADKTGKEKLTLVKGEDIIGLVLP